jgi:predicted amidohydrolase
MSFAIALVQPLTAFGEGARELNLESAAAHVAAAAAAGALVVCLPESYPGDWREPVGPPPLRELAALARENGVFLVGGYAEPLDGAGSRCHNALTLFDPDGRVVGTYRRTTPNHAPWIYRGGEHWHFDWVPADDLPVFETDIGTIGLLMCSEVYAPELARTLALKGAELLLMPAGIMSPRSALIDTWRTLIWARAIENLVYTAMCSNVIAPGAEALAMVCSPEDVLLEARDEGIHLATVDLERVRWLRSEHDRLVPDPKPWKTKPGTLRDWRRQAIFDANPEFAQVADATDASSAGATLARVSAVSSTDPSG